MKLNPDDWGGDTGSLHQSGCLVFYIIVPASVTLSIIQIVLAATSSPCVRAPISRTMRMMRSTSFLSQICVLILIIVEDLQWDCYEANCKQWKPPGSLCQSEDNPLLAFSPCAFILRSRATHEKLAVALLKHKSLLFFQDTALEFECFDTFVRADEFIASLGIMFVYRIFSNSETRVETFAIYDDISDTRAQTRRVCDVRNPPVPEQGYQDGWLAIRIINLTT